jgi:hypothetical protein
VPDGPVTVTSKDSCDSLPYPIDAPGDGEVIVVAVSAGLTVWVGRNPLLDG